MTKLNGSTPIVVIGTVIAVMATFIGLQQKSICDLQDSRNSQGERMARVETKVDYIIDLLEAHDAGHR